MKTTAAVLALLLLCGCGTYPTLEQLEEQAYRTGDWSALEQRERTIARREFLDGGACPSGSVSYCEDLRCTCLQASAARHLMDSWN